MIDGAFEHQDTTGGGGLITDGATQWMTAGAGIQHIETPPERSGVRVACSTASSSGSTCPPRRSGRRRAIRTSRPATSPCVSTHDGGSLVRIIAGELDGHAGPG